MQNKKIPTTLGVVLILFMIAGIAFATNGLNQVKTFFTNASGDAAPSSSVEIANINSSSFTVYWTTAEKSGGAVFYGKTPSLGEIAIDERDLGGQGEKFQTHFVRVNGLSENTKYYFKVGETEGSYGNQSSSNAPFEVTTGPVINSSGNVLILTGSAQTNSGSVLTDGVVTWQSPGAAKIASQVKSDGTYSLNLSQLRSSDLNSLFVLEDNNPEKIIVISGDGEATINCLSGESSNLPEIKIGQELDCSESIASSSESETASSSAETQIEEDVLNLEEDIEGQGSFKSLVKSKTVASGSATASLNVEQGESFETSLPTFGGKVAPKQMVKIVIHSEDVYSGTVIAGTDGSWSWTPPANLAPGEHTATITIVNSNGTTQTVTRTFFVGEGGPLLPLTSGTPSGQISITPVVTAVPTQIPDEVLPETGVELPTLLALTSGLILIILSLGAIIFY